MFQFSSEIRWFLSGEVPQRFVEWFAGPQQVLEEREDVYVLIDKCRTVGIKLRQGKFEIKALIQESRPIPIDVGVEGQMESWIKWSIRNDAVPRFVQMARSETPTLTISKSRWLRKISLDSDDPIETDPENQPIDGCNIELTKIGVLGLDWWSFAFEAFGPRERTAANLMRGVRAFIGQSRPPVEFAVDNSLSYPSWISDLGSEIGLATLTGESVPI